MIESDTRTIRFIESLTAKIHDTPPSIDKLSDMFQDFYIKAEFHIATHISALSTRQSRVGSLGSSLSSKITGNHKDARDASPPSRGNSDSVSDSGREQQMLTRQEISDRRKARRLLDRKGIALEEAVERKACERVYRRIWRHRATLDEVRDEKLRSRTAALALVGIGLKDLGIDIDDSIAKAKKVDVEQWISKARDGLLRMNDAKYPLGKLQQLAAAHKCIVDLLTAIHQSSSSADEILPTLIYTLITCPPEGINVISNLHFIQRFRTASKVDGEAAYCLVNLEAAITFLEKVDLASLRSDESLEGPGKSASRPTTPLSEGLPEWRAGRSKSASISSQTSNLMNGVSQQPAFDHPLQSPGIDKRIPTPSPSHQRKLSNLFQPPAAFGAAGDAVRSTADQSLRTIGNTLDSSFKLLFGRLKEQKITGEGVDASGSIIVPKTLDDARRLVEPKAEDDEENTRLTHDENAEPSHEQIESSNLSSDSILSAIVGSRKSRDRSVDSVQSSASGNKVAPALGGTPLLGKEGPSSVAAPPPVHSGSSAVESMRHIGNAFNPLKGFGGMGVFGRSSSSGGPTSAPMPTMGGTSPSDKPKEIHGPLPVDNLAPMKTLPPIQRFLELADVKDLKIGEVSELLSDYKRLAEALRVMGAF